MKSGKKILKYIIFLFPLVCGTVGFLLEKEPILDSLFSTVQMYVLNYPYVPPNFLVEIARWTAPFVSAYSVILIASTLRTRIANYFRGRREDSVAVYGLEEQKNQVLSALGKKGIAGGDAPSAAQSHILLWDEAENLRFYDQNKEAFKGKNVYLKCSALPAQAAAGENIHIFCPEETAARLYWKENFLYETSANLGHHMQIVFIGFGKLGSELLTHALQNNIFSPEQRIEYHIFGGNNDYLKIHHSLDDVQDAIIFHEDGWLDNLKLLEEAEKIIVIQQDGQTELISQLLLSVKEKKIDVFSANETGFEILGSKERLSCFAWKDLAYKPENILSENLYRRAKAINLRYAYLYMGAEETEENLNKEWAKLDTFTRYSNISSADYHEIRLKMLSAMGEETDPDKVSPECMELLSELEHMRWCRYHWLNNWTLGIPENGKNKDAEKRIHHDLKPYDQLTEPEKQKDRDAIRILLELKDEKNL